MVEVTVRLTKRQAEAMLQQCAPPEKWYGHRRTKAATEAFERIAAALREGGVSS